MRKLTDFGEFCKWLEAKGFKMTSYQSSAAGYLFGMPSRGGKSWLITKGEARK